jgi:hypothetical protein
VAPQQQSSPSLPVAALREPSSTHRDSMRYFQRPGHCFPLCYQPGGVLSRPGHTEASYDLTVLAGLTQCPGGVLAEIVREDGQVMRYEELQVFAKKHRLVVTSVQDLIAYRLEELWNQRHHPQEDRRMEACAAVQALYAKHAYTPPGTTTTTATTTTTTTRDPRSSDSSSQEHR